jgi:glycosyltransferase involved in cell wall biosynthesis
VNEDWFFLSHRLVLARAVRDAGAEVSVAAGDTGKAGAIRAEGLAFTALPISRAGTRPWEEARTLLSLMRLYRRIRPDLVHHVSPKPVLYGSLAARAVSRAAVVNAISGLGYAFTSAWRATLLRPIVTLLYRAALAHPRSRTVFQNHEHYHQFIEAGLIRRDRAVMIRGSGVDCDLFRPTPEPTGRPVVVLAGRMLWDKGIQEFVDAARHLRASDAAVRFALVGWRDPDNPRGVPEAQLEAWAREGVVEWWGHREDMPAVLAAATLVVLPTSYPEGTPKILVEAAACGRAIIASDAPGCREVVRHDVNGLLVPLRDGAALARAIETLVAAPALRARFGRAGREIAVAEFSDRLVVRQTLALYRELLGGGWPPPPAPD